VVSSDTPEQDVDRWVRKFEGLQPRYRALEAAVFDDLTSVISASGLSEQVHDVRHRIKALSSFREKIERKGYADPFSEMRDLVGIRVVCLYPSVLKDIDQVIHNTFEVVRFEDKSKGESPELWRYSSIHYDCRIPASHSGPRYDQIKDVVFEIQVRTILQDAWATVEHKLGYKNEKSIPDELKRDFSALAGLFHVADSSFQNIANEVKKSEQAAKDTVSQLMSLYRQAEEAASKPASDAESQAIAAMIAELESSPDAVIDRSTLKALLRGFYSGRQVAEDSEYSDFVEELAQADYVSLRGLRELLRDGHDRAIGLEMKRPGFDLGRRLNDVDFARLVMSVLSAEFRDVRRRRHEPS
jgi:putative GTP pyrophosphokinase